MMISATLLLDKERAVGAELPQVPAKGDGVMLAGMRWQVVRVTWVLDQRSENTVGCTDVLVQLKSLGV